MSTSLFPSGGLWLPADLWQLPDLELLEAATLAALWQFGRDAGSDVTNGRLAEILRTSERTVRRILARLRALGYLEAIVDPINPLKRVLRPSERVKAALWNTTEPAQTSTAPLDPGQNVRPPTGPGSAEYPRTDWPEAGQRDRRPVELSGAPANSAAPTSDACLNNQNSSTRDREGGREERAHANTSAGSGTPRASTTGTPSGPGPGWRGMAAPVRKPTVAETHELAMRELAWPVEYAEVLRVWIVLHDGEPPVLYDAEQLRMLAADHGSERILAALAAMGDVRARSIRRLKELIAQPHPIATTSADRHGTHPRQPILYNPNRTNLAVLAGPPDDWRAFQQAEAERQRARRTGS